MRFFLFTLFTTLLFGSAEQASAQRDWRAYPAQREARAIAASDEQLWVATSGGVFSFRPASGEIARYTPANGLYGVEVEAIAYDSTRDAVWVGYVEGVLDRINVATGTVTSFYDIARADQYSDRSIRGIQVRGDSLFVGTGFGLVVFDPMREETRDTYARLGPLPSATPVEDGLVAPLPNGDGDALWLATAEGVVYADLRSPNLRQPSAWTLDPNAPDSAQTLASFDGQLYVGTSKQGSFESGAYVRTADDAWDRVFTQRDIRTLIAGDEQLLGVSPTRVVTYTPGAGEAAYRIEGYTDLRDVTIGPGGDVWGGDGGGGLFQTDILPGGVGNIDASVLQAVIPQGPLLNAVSDLAIGADATLWVAHTKPGELTGLSRLDGDGWLNLEAANMAPGLVSRRGFMGASVGPNGTLYAGTQGDGLAVVPPEGSVIMYDVSNSSLEESAGFGGPVVFDAVADDAGFLWVTNFRSSAVFSVRSPAGEWVALPYPFGRPASVFAADIVIDSFGRKWVTLHRDAPIGNSNLGMAVISTGSDPLDPSDDEAIYITEAGGGGVGLPDADVRALAFDPDGQLWIGTARGLAVINAPEAAFAGDAALIQPQWARTRDGSDYLLRDLTINDMAVDAAGQLWLASTTGAWLLNAAKDSVLVRLTRENSPLFSDNIVDIAIEAESGRVFLATDRGLLSFQGEATEPEVAAEELKASPSPYRPAQHARGVLIQGLAGERTVFVLTPDGQRVASLPARGGTVRWDGRDERTGEGVASGIYLIAAVSANGEKTTYGKIAVIR